jgi:hypothetical protein
MPPFLRRIRAQSLVRRGTRYLTDAARAFERAPVEIVILIVVAVAYSHTVQTDTSAIPMMELAIAGLLLMAFAWTGTLLHALGAWTARGRRIVTLAGAVVAGLYAWHVLDLERGTEGWRAAMVLTAATLWVVAVPALAGEPGRRLEGATDRVRAVAGRVLLRAIGAGLYAVALYAGLALALAAIDTLFELGLDYRIYAHVAGWIFLVLAPWLVIAGLPEYAQPVEPRRELAGVARRMLTFLLPPLVALYYAILYAYTIRIAITGEVPQNLVSPLVIAAGVLAALALFLFDPRAREEGWSRLLRAAPPLFLPLAALGIYAVSLRVGQYGWTEFRLLRVIVLAGLALLAAAGTVQLVRGRRFSLHGAPAAFAALMVLAAVGPWSVIAVSRSSQQARLDSALRQAGVDPAVPSVAVEPPRARGPARPVAAPGPGPEAATPELTTIPRDLYWDLRSTALYLAEQHGVETLPPALASVADSPEARFDLPARAGLRPEPTPADADRALRLRLARWTPVPLAGATAHYVSAPGRPGVAAGRAALVPGTTLLRIVADGEAYTVDLERLSREPADPARRTGEWGELSPDVAALPVHDGRGAHRGTLIVLMANLQSEGDALDLRLLEGLLILDAP